MFFRSMHQTRLEEVDEPMIGSQDSQKSVCDQTINFGEETGSPSFATQGLKTPGGNSIVGEISLGLDNGITPVTTPDQDNAHLANETTFFEAAEIENRGDDNDLNRFATEAAQKAATSIYDDELFAPSPDTNARLVLDSEPTKLTKTYLRKKGGKKEPENFREPKIPVTRKRGRPAKAKPDEIQAEPEVPSKRLRGNGSFSYKNFKNM